MSQRKPLAACICIIALSIASLPVQATEFSGRAEVAFSPKSKNKKRAQAEQRAVLATLEQQARQGVIENALASVYGPKDAFLGKYEAVLADCVSNSSMLMYDVEIMAAGVLSKKAVVEILASVDEAVLTKFLRDKHGLSVTGDVATALKIFILSYTVEGADADPERPV